MAKINDEFCLDLSQWVAEHGVWFVVVGEVNIDDLLNARGPGAIVRIKSADAIKFLPPMWDNFERVAGLISDGT